MTAYPKVELIVRSVLKDQARRGQTTKHDVATRVWGKIERMGGPTKVGIGAGAVIMGCMHVIGNEVTKQLKSSLTDHQVTYILPQQMPAELIKLMNRIPAWIAIEDGTDALWMPWQKARIEHWQANAELKRKKAEQTLNAARFSKELADYMEQHGIATLSQIFREE